MNVGFGPSLQKCVFKSGKIKTQNILQSESDVVQRRKFFTFSIAFNYIGGIFDGANYESEVAFRYALRRASEVTRGFQLIPIIKYVSSTDSYKTEQIGEI
jgi:hypothetical protein